MAFETFPSVGPYAPEDLTADLNTNFGKTAEVALATLADGEFLVYDGSSSVWINRTAAEAGIPANIADLGDVTVATVADGEFMIYDGSSGSWINATAAEAGVPVNLEDLTNVSVATPADGEVLTYDGSSGSWINSTAAAGSSTLADLTDTSIATPAEGEVLTYDGSSGSWINSTAAAGSSTLADLTDTSIATPADGDLLRYNSGSGDWENYEPQIGRYHAQITSTVSNVTGNSVYYQIIWNNEITTTSFCSMNTSTGVFTLDPGSYIIEVGVLSTGGTATAGNAAIRFVTDGNTVEAGVFNGTISDIRCSGSIGYASTTSFTGYIEFKIEQGAQIADILNEARTHLTITKVF